jgi:hypothetical protein
VRDLQETRFTLKKRWAGERCRVRNKSSTKKRRKKKKDKHKMSNIEMKSAERDKEVRISWRSFIYHHHNNGDREMSI